jgi:hypothetical protein
MAPARLLTTAQVAADLGLSIARVKQLAISRHLGALYGNTTLFTRAEVDTMRTRLGPGRPRKVTPDD